MKIERPAARQKMSSNAKKVFKGILFDVYQWEQEQFDGSKAVYEQLKRTDTVQVIPVTPDGKIIITNEEQPGKPPFISVPGGRIDEGENPLEAAKRELLEESGYEAEEWILWDAQQPGGKIDWVVFTFIARECKRVADLKLDGGEKMEVREVDFDEFVEVATGENFYDGEITLKLLRAFKEGRMEEIKKEIFG